MVVSRKLIDYKMSTTLHIKKNPSQTLKYYFRTHSDLLMIEVCQTAFNISQL